MNDNKFKKFFYFVDIFSEDQSNINYLTDEERDSDLYLYFRPTNPLYIGVLMNYLSMIINKICSENKKEDIFQLVEDIKNNPSKYKGKYDYKDITLNKLFKGDYEFLKSHCIINSNVILNEESYIKKFGVEEEPKLLYPFSIQEYYSNILTRAINITIKNYFHNKNH